MPKARKGEFLAPPTELMRRRAKIQKERNIPWVSERNNDLDKLRVKEYTEHGNEQALFELIEDYNDLIAYVYHNPGKPPQVNGCKLPGFKLTDETAEDKEDLFSEIYTVFVECVHAYDDSKGTFANFIWYNLPIRVRDNYFRSVADDRTYKLKEEYNDEIVVSEESTENLFIEPTKNNLTEEQMFALMAYNELTEKQRQVVMLKCFENYSHALVAETMGITKKDAENTWYAAKNRMSKLLETKLN
jgi:RNA polymerase sigma factor (sigma-70 family)